MTPSTRWPRTTGSTWTYFESLGRDPELTEDTIRFVDWALLKTLIREAGLGMIAGYGDWDRSPISPGSPELIMVLGAAA